MTGNDLTVTLYWLANQRPLGNYKVLVHLTDSVTGQLVAQTDVVPANWQFPTLNWSAGEIVRDQIVLPLQDVPSGSYLLMLGLYDAVSGERLAPVSGDPAYHALEDNRLLLPQRVHISGATLWVSERTE
jgi:hypothetical protein